MLNLGIMNGDSEMFLSERPSPDGGEDFITPIASEEDETWLEWDSTVSYKSHYVYDIAYTHYSTNFCS